MQRKIITKIINDNHLEKGDVITILLKIETKLENISIHNAHMNQPKIGENIVHQKFEKEYRYNTNNIQRNDIEKGQYIRIYIVHE